MPDLPSGTVTFLFTDIEGSTPLWEQMPSEMEASLARHHAILRQAIEANGGQVTQIIGDEFQSVFRTATEALRAALAAQQGLRDATWGATGPIRVRMGLHTGPAEPDPKGDAPYAVGHTLNRAGRVRSTAWGGQILLSQETRDLVERYLPEGVSLKDLGEHHLKGMHIPEHLYQAVAPDLPSSFPQLATAIEHPHNLPVQLTSFIGREKEIGEIRGLLLDGRTRLVTLTGSGGCGKTRLALEAAGKLVEVFPAGVWLVELAPLADPGQAPAAVASALGLQIAGSVPMLEALTDYIKKRRLLLLLDNCEHLLDVCARLVDHLLRASPGLVVLASSREGLGIGGEVSYRVPSLGLQDPHQAPTVETIAQSEAARLFVSRACQASPGFQVTPQNAPAIAQVCQRLDGIPLAIELAAARVSVLSVEQIALRLSDRFRLLTGGSRTALPRQQTLRASIDWSYSILTESERRLLKRLSVFAGGCTLEGAERICSDTNIHVGDVLDLLTTLVKKSLVIYLSEAALPLGQEPRYQLLETIRQYARERLLDDADGEVLRQNHLQYFAGLAEQARRESHSPRQMYWKDRLDLEQDNIRAALEWGLQDEQPEIFDAGLRLICTTGNLTGHLNVGETIGWLERYRAQEERMASISPSRLAQTIRAEAWSWFRQGEFLKARQAAQESLALSTGLGDRQNQVGDLIRLAFYTSWTDNNDTSIEILNRAVAFAEQLDLEQQNLADLLFIRPFLYHEKDPELAKRYYEEVLKVMEKWGDRLSTIGALRILGEIAGRQGDDSRAQMYLQKAVAISRETNSLGDLQWDLFVSGDHAYSQGRFEQMEAFFQEARQVCEKTGFRRGSTWGIHHVGVAARRQGQHERAIRLACESLSLAQEYEYLEVVLESVASLAVLAGDLRRWHHSALLLGACKAWQQTLHTGPIAKSELERGIRDARAALGDETFEAAFAEGQSLTLEDAAELGREAVKE